MTGVLRSVGLLIAAIWLGGAVYFSFAAGTLPFSPDMKSLVAKMGESNAGFQTYFIGAAAQLGVARYFKFQLICCIGALAHLGIEWMYQERRGRKSLLAMLLVILGLTLLGEFALLPKMRELHAIKYARPTAYYTPERREAAATSFKHWHAASQVANLFVLGGLVVYLFSMGRQPETTRFVRPPQFRS
ncbi:MAG: hypothetical protein RLY20_2568 [Verrucomicrobiota bacterium]|jgi:hypothetical protein